MIGPLQENARMLASLIGVDEDEAAERLDCTVLMTVATDAVSQTWAAEIQALLERTVNVVLKPNSDACAVELIVGQTAPRTSATRVYALSLIHISEPTRPY